jgi:hypothetical protein
MSVIGGRAENICSFRVFLSLTDAVEKCRGVAGFAIGGLFSAYS